MCTAVTYKTKDFYFGRTLDYERSFGEEVVITPRGYRFDYRYAKSADRHYAIIGMAHVENGYPLYYDAVNEKGLCMAGLNFVGNAQYSVISKNGDNIAVFEFIPWVLGQCKSLKEATALLSRINLVGDAFNEQLPTAQLHWLIADRDRAVAVEQTKDGLKVYDDPVGVLTNNPTFDIQLFRLNDHIGITTAPPSDGFADGIKLCEYSRGMGALGLPGDLSSGSRFVRAAFTKLNSVSGGCEAESVNQFFHILGSVQQVRGCCDVGNGEYEITLYSSCCNADRGIYYYTTYGNHCITAVDMHSEDTDGSVLIRFPLISGEQIARQN